MCRKYALRTPLENVIQMLAPLTIQAFPKSADWSIIVPGQYVPIIRFNDEQDRKLSLVQWGLVPPWAKKPWTGGRTINAPAEALSDRPAFCHAFAYRRCLVPANGYFDWRIENEKKHLMYVHPPDDRLFCFAGLWERWESTDSSLETMAIVVTWPSRMAASLSNRMPVILNPEDYDTWLNPLTDRDVLQRLMCPFAGELLADPANRRAHDQIRNDLSAPSDSSANETSQDETLDASLD